MSNGVMVPGPELQKMRDRIADLERRDVMHCAELTEYRDRIAALEKALGEAEKSFELIKDLKLSVTVHEIICDEALAALKKVKGD